MTDDFLSNSNYYNKGGLNGKPKEPRPIPPKGQQSSNKSELIFKQLTHERNELRKYIVNICELLGIDTSQSVLGANCLEFYAVLSSTVKDKIGDLHQQLKRKGQECKEINLTNERLVTEKYTMNEKILKLNQALDKIEKIVIEANSISSLDSDEIRQIRNIINKIKE